MELVRKETPFDGRENDWMAFAMQQAEFYKHANQYIMNIRLDIEELDDAIADLMEEFLYGRLEADTYVQAETVEEEPQIGVAV